jgi:hypothetical protein
MDIPNKKTEGGTYSVDTVHTKPNVAQKPLRIIKILTQLLVQNPETESTVQPLRSQQQYSNMFKKFPTFHET